jgi:hypothetical protein
MISFNKKKHYFFLISLIAIPVIIYFYFLKWQTVVAYGDDLYIFRDYYGLDSFSEKINLPVSFEKYRPVHGFSMYLMIEWFQKNLDYYYLFNVGIQTINTFLFAITLNLFLKSPYFSLFFSLIIGISKFSYFNISQLLNGGAMEGLAMTFFLASLYFFLKTTGKNDQASSQKQRMIIWSIVFANLSIYTHERYIVMLPFIAVAIFILPSLKILSRNQKIGLGLVALVSILINVIVKKYIYSLPFFVGTAGTNIDFSFSSAISFLGDAILSLFQINSGAEHLIGIPFSSLPLFTQVLAVILAGGTFLILILFLFQAKKLFEVKENNTRTDFFIFMLLAALGILFLIPAVITVRLEQRWLQAPLSIFILLVVVALKNLKVKNSKTRNYLFLTFILTFLWIDAAYFFRGAENLYMSHSLRLASKFKRATDNGTIHPATGKIYIWEMKRDENTETVIKWVLGDGYLFDFYQGKDKKIFFADSIFQKNYSFAVSSFINFNKNKDQIIYIHDDILDITDEYLKDSLKSFSPERASKLTHAPNIQYDQKNLLITNDDFDKFLIAGFYELENEIRWTNGNASIEFMGEYILNDSVELSLTTYMPPICKDIAPKISLVDRNNNEYQPIVSTRNEDKFNYRFYFQQATNIQKIKILGNTINALPDQRVLSFPFISLELKN